MSEKITYECDGCGEGVTMDYYRGDTDMLWLLSDDPGAVLVLRRTLRDGESLWPRFHLNGKHWHPACLLKALAAWIKEVE